MAFAETGHAQNAAKFHTLLTKITSLGATYNPSKTSIKVAALTTLQTNADGSITTVDIALVPFNNATNQREIAFLPLSELLTRVINALKATDATSQTIKDAVFLQRKIVGRRAKAKVKAPLVPPPPPPVGLPVVTPVYISASQLQFDSRIENFNKLILLLGAEPLYVPNETALAVAGLTTFSGTMSSTNTSVKTLAQVLKDARAARNIVLYKTNTGLYDIAKAVKKYVLSLYGSSSTNYKQLTAIKFSKPAKKFL